MKSKDLAKVQDTLKSYLSSSQLVKAYLFVVGMWNFYDEDVWIEALRELGSRDRTLLLCACHAKTLSVSIDMFGRSSMTEAVSYNIRNAKCLSDLLKALNSLDRDESHHMRSKGKKYGGKLYDTDAVRDE